jgi:hypothetical protein
MTSVPETSLVTVVRAAEDAEEFGPVFAAMRPVDVPNPRRPSPTPLVVLGLLAGIAAMVLGGVAVVSAVRAGDDAAAPVVPAERASTTPLLEQQVLALLAKPSTDRVVFRGSGGRLLLVVGSAGRAAILARGLETAPAGSPYRAWILRSGRPIRAATFTGAERAVFLSTPVLRGESVVIASNRRVAVRPKAAGLVATRG